MSHAIKALASATLAVLAAPVVAAPAVGLVDDRTLVMFDTNDATVTSTSEIEGVDRLLGIDYRPGTGQLIGVTDDFRILAIDLETREAVELAVMDTPLPLVEGQPVIVDFNPAADRLRFMSGTTNHRVHPDTGEVTVDGALAYLADDANAAATPMVAAAAYTNSYGKPEGTAMFNIDTALSALVQQTAPNDGTLATIGSLGVMIEGPVALDIATTETGENTVWLAALGGLHTIDIDSGTVSESWPLQGLDGDLRDIAVLPAM